LVARWACRREVLDHVVAWIIIEVIHMHAFPIHFGLTYMTAKRTFAMRIVEYLAMFIDVRMTLCAERMIWRINELIPMVMLKSG
jgi:hypothetical protein